MELSRVRGHFYPNALAPTTKMSVNSILEELISEKPVLNNLVDCKLIIVTPVYEDSEAFA
jgi:hypothetical protein